MYVRLSSKHFNCRLSALDQEEAESQHSDDADQARTDAEVMVPEAVTQDCFWLLLPLLVHVLVR